jgi:CRISPR-associated protein Cas1
MALRKLLNTLYITAPEAYLGRERENVIVRIDDEIRFRIPIHNSHVRICGSESGSDVSLC